MKSDRIVYFDYLRVFAIIAVIFVHVAAFNWYDVDVTSFDWQIYNIYDSFFRWCVPVFCMISGSLFLSKNVDTKSLYTKYIPRLVVSYCVWSVFYAVLLPLCSAVVKNDFSFSLKSVLLNMIGGSYHMWFIPMIIGIYICIPILKQIVLDKNITKYFLIVSFVFSFLIPQIVNLCNDFAVGVVSGLVNNLNSIVNNMNIHLVLGYSFYFILGYWLSNIELIKKQRLFFYLLGLVGFVSTIVLTAVISYKTQDACDTYYDYFNINVLFETVAVHTFIKYRRFENEKINLFFSKLSNYSFGAYLIHVFVIFLLDLFGLNTLNFTFVISVPVISIVVVVISFVLSFVMNCIPKVNKWIV